MLKHQYSHKIILLCLLSLISNCTFLTENETEKPDYIDPVDIRSIHWANYPKVDGSTSCHPLQIVIACEILGVDYEWLVFPDGMSMVRPLTENPDKDADFTHIQSIWHSGTHGSYVNLISDSVDLTIAARLPSEDERSLADSLNVALSTKAIALDAFVFILNAQNPVDDLSVEPIRGIYSGAITNWNSLGGENAAINPYRRNKNSGSQELMEKLVMKDLPMAELPDMLNLFSMMGPINTLVNDPHGIGYTVYFFNTFMAPRENIKLCAIEGVYPDPQTISNGTYLYTTRVYTAIRTNLGANSTARTLWKWLQTQDGQQTVSKSGYIPHLEHS